MVGFDFKKKKTVLEGPSGLCPVWFVLIVMIAFPGWAQDTIIPTTLSQNKTPLVTVAKVIAVDRFITEDGRKIRLIGIKPLPQPKKKQPITETEETNPLKNPWARLESSHDPVIPLPERAFRFVRDLLESKTVRLEFDRQRTDEDFYEWAYVYLSEQDASGKPKDLFVNAAILEAGYADLTIRFPNNARADALRAAYQAARAAKRGWHSEY